MKLLVGCPVRRRSWVMDHWFDHVEAALARAHVGAEYLFVVPDDDETLDTIARRAPTRMLVLSRDEPAYRERSWADEARVAHMVELRNALLRGVRDLRPDVFLSVDSDVLLAPEAVADLLESLASGRFGAVGGATWMTGLPSERGALPSEDFPSCGWVHSMAGLVRQRIEARGVIPVGVIMAVKAMHPSAYGTDYELRRDGEDVGWSVACGRGGVRLGWDNRHPSKHVMDRAHLDRVDVRCGF